MPGTMLEARDAAKNKTGKNIHVLVDRKQINIYWSNALKKNRARKTE